MSKLLAIDDDRIVLRLVQKAFVESPHEIMTAGDPESGMRLVREFRPDVLLLDIMLPANSGIELALQVRELDPKLPIIFITASEDSGMAIEAMKLGAYEYLLKPLEVERIRELVERAIQTRRLMLEPVKVQDGDELPINCDALIGRSPKMLEVYKQIGRIAGQDVSVLIRGESGTGKELIARAIYHFGKRKNRCYLAVNCAALTDTLLESELFGHEKGAFTGADRQHIGKFEQCNEGTIFLDEVGDMSPLTQSKVLRLLQEKRFERVGGKTTITVDTRVISATNRPLEQMIAKNEFRLDLFHRLNAFEIELPPLRERENDIELLIMHFLMLFNRQLDKRITGLSVTALEILKSYRWPGNVRQLQSVIRKAMLMSTGPVIVPEFLPKEIIDNKSDENATGSGNSQADSNSLDFVEFIDQRLQFGSTSLYAETLVEMERHLLCRVLQFHSGNQSRAAQQLGITRGSLRNKIRALGISIGHVVNEGDA